MPKYGSLYQSSGHTIKEFYKISLSTINVRCIIPSFTDLLFPIFGAFIVNIVPFFAIYDFTTIMSNFYFLRIQQINLPGILYCLAFNVGLKIGF